MATSEVEDIAALVGIEIVPEGTCKDVSEESEQQPPHTPDRPTIAQPGIGECGDPAGAGFSADILTMCSSERLSALEEEFADRYTKHDEEFVKTLATPTHPPPCVTPWWSNDKGDRSRGQGWGRGRGWGRGHSDRRDYQDRGDYQQRSHGHHDNRYQGRQREDSWDRRDDHRDRDHSSGRRDDHRDRDHSWGRRDDHRDRDHRQYRDRSPERRDRH